MAMAKGGFHESFFTTSWPTGEFGGMGLEGAVKAGYKKELEAISNPEEREALYNKLVAHSYERGKAINTAAHLEIDAVIDPADTRKWLMEGLRSVPAELTRQPGHTFVDPW
jgi:acetyl-CoA carboxylase carboxyltransferase component